MRNLLAFGVVLLGFTACEAGVTLELGDILEGSGLLEDNIVNNGELLGSSVDDPFVVPDGYVVSGGGVFENVVVLGTFAPGNSPVISSVTNHGVFNLDIELGGTIPGSGSNNHDQVNDSGTLGLNGGTLNVTPFGGFIPSNGDTFTILTWQNGLSGSFSSIVYDSFYANNGVSFASQITNPGGTGDWVLTASRVPEPGAFVVLLMLLCGVCGIRQQCRIRACRDETGIGRGNESL